MNSPNGSRETATPQMTESGDTYSFPVRDVPNAIDDRPFPAAAQMASADADDPVD